jgi:two-component system, NarL family, response regulator DevR
VTGQAATKQIRVMLVEDHADYRALLQVLLISQSDIKLLAQAGSLAEARDHAAKLKFDVVVLDLGLPDGHGEDLIVDFRRSNPDVGVLVLSASLDPLGIEQATRLGADEIMDKLDPLEEVLSSVRRLGSA